jgi:hypothetical protein
VGFVADADAPDGGAPGVPLAAAAFALAKEEGKVFGEGLRRLAR